MSQCVHLRDFPSQSDTVLVEMLQVVLVYMAVSGLVGLAVTYYYDRDDNVKLHNILKYGLKLVGLLLMAFSMSMPEASVTLCCVLLAVQLIQPLRFLWWVV